MVTEKQADNVADKIQAQFESEAWFGGVGIGVDEDERYIQIYSSSADANVPLTLDGVKIKLVNVTLKAQTA